jgi:flavin reductase (DIM6/NTAB) family NADH-FMN oxidoreductase RutF
MNTKDIEVYERFKDCYKALMGNGALLAVKDKTGRKNIMTIGWATIGVIWYEPIFAVLVRPSRYTHELLDNSKYFSVNVPVNKLDDALSFCGSKTGRKTDKVKGSKLTVGEGKTSGTIVVEDCDIFFECEILNKNCVIKDSLDPAIADKYYEDKSFHTVFYGKIIKAYEKVK